MPRQRLTEDMASFLTELTTVAVNKLLQAYAKETDGMSMLHATLFSREYIAEFN